MRRRTAGLVAAGVLGAATMGMGTAASAAPESRLPDADLVCGDTTLTPDQWVALPQSGTLWVSAGDLAGHYVIVSVAHYYMPGYQVEPPDAYDGLMFLDDRTFGAKAAFDGESIPCDFVSRWGEDGAEDTFSVVGPMTIAPTGR